MRSLCLYVYFLNDWQEVCVSWCHTSFGHKRLIRQDMNKEELKDRIRTVIDMEERGAQMAPITPLYVSRMLNVPLEEVEKCMKEMGIA